MLEKIVKNTPYVCPFCGRNKYVECEEYELNSDTEIEFHFYCTECDKSFVEYFKMEYDGYRAEGKEYNKNGEEF